MSAALVLPSSSVQQQGPRLKRFTRAEYEVLIESGIFAGQRCELVDGELIDKMGQNPPHAQVIRSLQARLTRTFGERVQGQLPVEVRGQDGNWSLPEPDIAVMADDKAELAKRHPRSDELLLLIEVADSSARFDLGDKRDLYARAGVCEYWVVDLNRRLLVIHREPHNGFYSHVDTLSETDIAAIGELTIPVAEILA